MARRRWRRRPTDRTSRRHDRQRIARARLVTAIRVAAADDEAIVKPNGGGGRIRYRTAGGAGRLLTRALIALVIGGVMTLSGCGDENQPTAPEKSSAPTSTGGITTLPLQIERIDAADVPGPPRRLDIQVRGIIPDSCSTAREPQVSRSGSQISVQILIDRPTGLLCAQIISPYERTIPISPIDPGAYHISVNDQAIDVTVS
jgi:inhibitor of cysteine peptidase